MKPDTLSIHMTKWLAGSLDYGVPNTAAVFCLLALPIFT